jgi:tRNA A37 threonylcarbamoyladenosine modification protein TsaB
MRIPKRTALIAQQIGRIGIALAPTLGLTLGFALSGSTAAYAHAGPQNHVHIMTKPYAGIRNNYWFDYKSDIEEAESELASDLRRAKTAQDRREAWAEYNRELADARHDYRKEMVERHYILPGKVTVGR